jgi:predicted anti-sigma-YlaC factor YlaD
MNAHLTQREREAYDGGAMSADELLTVSEHLTHCAECRRRLPAIEARLARAVVDVRTLLRAEPEAHLPYEQLEAFVDGALDDVEQEIVTTHLEDCASCRAHADELRALAGPRRSERESEAARFVPASRGARRPRRIVWYAAAAVLLLVGIGLASLWRSKATGVPSPIAVATTTEPPPPRAIVALRDANGGIVLEETGSVRGVPPAIAPAIATVLRTDRFAAPAILASLHSPVAALRGPRSQTLAIVGPIGRVLMDDRPPFTWRGAGGTSEVTVFDEQGTTVATSGVLRAAEWTPSQPLPRGTTLIWQVASAGALAPAADDPQARFRVVDAAAVARIAEARASGSHLALAVAYAEAGLRDESEAELVKLQALNPSSPVAESLLRSLRSWPR